MKKLIIISFMTLGISLFADNITTLDKKTYYNVEVITKTATDLTIECTRTPVPEEGKALRTIKLSKLDEATLQKYGYDKEQVTKNLRIQQKNNDTTHPNTPSIADKLSSNIASIKKSIQQISHKL